MALNFPSAPAVDQEYTDPNGGVWVFDGAAWNRSRIPIAASLVSVIDAAGHYAADDVETTLAEVGTKIALKLDKVSNVDLEIAKASPSITLDSTPSGDGTIRFQVNNTNRKSIFVSSGTGALHFLDHDAGVFVAEISSGQFKMAGASAVTVPTPTATTHAARKDYVDTANALKVAKAGDTMTGNLVIAKAIPNISLNAPGAADFPSISFQHAGVTRWQLMMTTVDAQLYLARVNASGVTQDYPIRVQADGVINMAGALSVLLPTPTAANHGTRKDYVDNADALKVAKTGDTMTGNLAIGKDSPTLSLNATGAADNAVINLQDGGITRFIVFRQASDGTLRIGRCDAAGAFLGSPVVVTDTGQVNLSGAVGGVTVPAISGTSQAAQVTGFDAATGRLAIGGVEVGDTGWRDVSSWLINGWTANKCYIRRVGSMVTLNIHALNGSARSGTVGGGPNHFIDIVDATFRWLNGNQAPAGTMIAYNSTTGHCGVHCATTTMFTPYTGTQGYITVTFPITRSWPTSLPGTPGA